MKENLTLKNNKVLIIIAVLIAIAIFVGLRINTCNVAAYEAMNVATVMKFVEEGYNERNTEALREAFAATFVQHTPYIADGVDGFISFYEQEFNDFPNPYMDVKRVFAEDNKVVVHMHLLFDKSEIGDDFATGYALVSMFELNDESKITNYWGLTQQVGPFVQSVNGHSLFDGVVNKRTQLLRDDQTEEKVRQKYRKKNTDVVREYTELFFNEDDYDNPRLRELVADDLIQHNPTEPNGLDGLIEIFKGLRAENPGVKAYIMDAVADGEFVVTQMYFGTTKDGFTRGEGIYTFDIYRVVEGTIVEHWDVLQPVAVIESKRVDTNTNSLFY